MKEFACPVSSSADFTEEHDRNSRASVGYAKAPDRGNLRCAVTTYLEVEMVRYEVGRVEKILPTTFGRETAKQVFGEHQPAPFPL